MRRFIFILTLILSATCVHPAAADVAERAQTIIAKHMEAIRANDADATIAAWKELNSDPAALKFIQTNNRATYAYLKLKELAYRLQKLNEEQGLNYTYISPVEGLSEGEGNAPGLLQGNPPNRSYTRDIPNNANRVRSLNDRISNSRLQTTNGELVAAYSNQERVRSYNNQDRLRRNR